MTPIVDAADLHKSFGARRAVDGIGLVVHPGESLAVLGPNGAGKTTTMRILATTLRPDAGSVTIDGIDALRDRRAARRRIGLVAQRVLVDPQMTGREHLHHYARLCHLGRASATRRATEMLEAFALADVGDNLARTYSWGMRRRLDIAIAMVHGPPLLILDEPSVGLDLESRHALWAALRELTERGTAILYTSQIFDDITALAGRVLFISDGRIRRSGHVGALSTRQTPQIRMTVIGRLDAERCRASLGAWLDDLAVTHVQDADHVITRVEGRCRPEIAPWTAFDAVTASLRATGDVTDATLETHDTLESIYLQTIADREPDR